MQRLFLYKGLCYYKLQQHENAREIFKLNPTWQIWQKKNEVLQKIIDTY